MEPLLTARMEWGRAALDLYWVEPSDAAKHLMMYMTIPHNQTLSDLNVDSAESGKLSWKTDIILTPTQVHKEHTTSNPRRPSNRLHLNHSASSL